MKSITLYLLENENPKNAWKYFRKFSNSLLRFDSTTKKFYFSSNYKPKEEEIHCLYNYMQCNAKEIGNVESILNAAMLESKRLSSENFGQEVKKGSVLSGLVNTINKYHYISNGDKDIFDLTLDLFVKILMGHYLTNGNKRLAITFLKGFLWERGYYLKWTQGIFKEYDKHKMHVEKFVEKLQNRDNNDKVKTKAEIKIWIMNNVIIALNWRSY